MRDAITAPRREIRRVIFTLATFSFAVRCWVQFAPITHHELAMVVVVVVMVVVVFHERKPDCTLDTHEKSVDRTVCFGRYRQLDIHAFI